MVSTAVKAALPATAGPGFDSRLLHEQPHQGLSDEEDKMAETVEQFDMDEVGFDLVGYQVTIHAPASSGDEALDKALEYLMELDMEPVLEEAIYEEIGRWNETLGVSLAVPIAITAVVT